MLNHYIPLFEPTLNYCQTAGTSFNLISNLNTFEAGRCLVSPTISAQQMQSDFLNDSFTHAQKVPLEVILIEKHFQENWLV